MDQTGVQAAPDGYGYAGHWLRSLGPGGVQHAFQSSASGGEPSPDSIATAAASGAVRKAGTPHTRSDSHGSPFDVPAGYRTTLTTDRMPGASNESHGSAKHRHHSGPQDLQLHMKQSRRGKRGSPGYQVREASGLSSRS